MSAVDLFELFFTIDFSLVRPPDKIGERTLCSISQSGLWLLVGVSGQAFWAHFLTTLGSEYKPSTMENDLCMHAASIQTHDAGFARTKCFEVFRCKRVLI